jgi:hypothetical protein
MQTYVQSLRVAAQYPCKPQLLQLLLQPAGETRVHAAATAQHNRLVQAASDVDLGGLDGVEQELGDTGLLNVHKMRLEQALGSLEALAAHPDDPAVWERVGFDEHGSILAEPLVELEVVRHVAELLFDLADGLEVGGSVERVASP